MGIVVRQSILSSAISYVGIIIGYVNLLYLYPKFLNPDEVGLLRIVQDAAILMAPFATVGMVHSVLRFFPQYSQSKPQADSFSGLIVLIALSGSMLFLITFFIFEQSILGFFKDNAKAIIEYKNLVLLLTLILVFLAIFEQFAKATLAIALPPFLREILLRVLQAVIVILYFYSIISFDQFVVASVLIYLLCLMILLIFLSSRKKMGISFKNLSHFPAKKIFSYGATSFVSASAMILVGKMDSIMVTGFLGLSAVAIYTTAYYMATVIEVPKRALTQTTTILMARAFEQQNHEEVNKLYRKTALNQLIIGLLLMIGVWANLGNLFNMMPKGSYYEAGSLVVIWVGIGKLIDMAFGPSSELIGLSRYYWFNLVSVCILAAVVIVANYFLIPEYGIEGAAYGSIVALVFFNLVKFVFIWTKLNMQPFSSATIKVCAIAAVTAVVNSLLPSMDVPIVDILYRSTIITAIFGLLILVTKSSEDINRLFGAGIDILKRYIKL